MICGIIFCVVVCCADFSKGLQEYKNDCGTITVAQPAIHEKFVLLTFIPNGPVDDQTKVAWKYRSDYVVAWRKTDISNSSRYILSSRNATYTMDLYCDKDKVDFSGTEFSATRITSSGECTSMWIGIYVYDAPALCGILYSETKQIKPNDEVVLKYYAPPKVLSGKQYIRQVRLKHDYCREQLGCPVNQTWYTEEYVERNSVYVYTIRNFTPDMGGYYLIQCTNGSSNNRATNTVRLIIPVPPSSPSFLNTMDIDGCESCIPVESSTYSDIECQVLGKGTFPVTVKIIIATEEIAKCTLDNPSRTSCKKSKHITTSLHLKEIHCEAVNEAISDPLSTSTKLYVVEKPWGPTLILREQSEGHVNIYCHNRKGRPAPELTMLIDGNPVNTTNVAKKDHVTHIKLTYLERDWNGAKIECCMQHLLLVEPKCSEKKIDYLFSPVSVNLTVSKLEPTGRGRFLQTLRCTVINANPACGVKWNHSKGANVTIRPEEIARPAGQGGYTTVSELLVNGGTEIDGWEIGCQPVCDEFETNDTSTHTIRIPYPPTLSINTSGPNSWRAGETVVFGCRVNSFSPANVTWYTSQNQLLDTFDCGGGAVCLQFDRIQEEDAGTYVCEAATEYFDPAVKSIILNIVSTATDKQISETREKTLPWTYIGIGAAATGVVVLILVTILVLKKRRSTDRRKTGNEDIPMNAPNGQAIANEPREEPNGADAYDSVNEPTYANADNRGKKSGENVNIAGPTSLNAKANTYEPMPIPEEQHMDSRDTDTNSGGQPGTSDLVYADLDLPTEGTTSTNPKIASAVPQTEYVSIDFNKVGEQLLEPTDTASENIYANQ